MWINDIQNEKEVLFGTATSLVSDTVRIVRESVDVEGRSRLYEKGVLYWGSRSPDVVTLDEQNKDVLLYKDRHSRGLLVGNGCLI